ncbi:MAG: RlmE family RNA methyltransferase [Gammaproteobacteria bacterium]
MKKRSASSQRWLQRQHNDPYTQMARAQGWRSRAVFKLEEIDKKDQLIRPGMKILDLGAAPGGWCQYLAKKLKGQGTIIALDILEMPPLSGVDFIQADFSDESVVDQLIADYSHLDLVICDIAPNLSGVSFVDIAKMERLNGLALEVARAVLKPGGSFLIKVFQGPDHLNYVDQLRSSFKSVVFRKPKASRAESRELYVLAKNRKE